MVQLLKLGLTAAVAVLSALLLVRVMHMGGDSDRRGVLGKIKIRMIMAMDNKTYTENVLGISAKRQFAKLHGHEMVVKIYSAADKARCKDRFHNCKVDFVQAELTALLGAGAAREDEAGGRATFLVWSDTDSYILKPRVTLSSFLRIAGNKDLVLTDHNVNINNGVFFLRASKWSKQFVQLWRDQTYREGHREWPYLDQGAMWEAILRQIKPRARHRYNHSCETHYYRQDLEKCFNGELAKLGYPYPHGTSDPHIAFVDPGATVGGFNSHECKEHPHFNNWKWRKDVCHIMGRSFMVHSKEPALHGRLSLQAVCNVTHAPSCPQLLAL